MNPTLLSLTATHAIATVQTFVASTTSNGDMTTSVARWSITLHIFRSCIYHVKT